MNKEALMRKLIVSLCIAIGLICNQVSFAQGTTGRVTVTDKEIIERLTRLEEGQKALNQRIDDVNESISKRIDDLNERMNIMNESLNKRIDSIQGLMWVLLAGMFALIGFVIWDRRSAISPVIRKTKELEAMDDRILKALREYSNKNPELSTVLKNFGLL